MFKQKKEKTTKKIAALLGILGMLFLETGPLVARAANTPPTPDQIAGTTGTFIQNAQSKTKGPAVQVAFLSDSGFKDGAKVTAIASTGGFSENPSNLYYTWYLKHPGCDLGGDNKSCDLDSDGKITVNDWKIAAARNIVRGNFIPDGSTYAATPAKFSDADAGAKAEPSIKEWNGSDPDPANDSNIPYCYVQEPLSGNIYELTEPHPNFDNACPSGSHPSCVNDATASGCVVPNPAYSQDDADAAAAAIPPVPYLVPTTIVAPDTQFCGATADTDADANTDAASIFKCTASSLKTWTAVVGSTCKNDNNGNSLGIPICAKDDQSNISNGTAIIFSKDNVDGSNVCSGLFPPPSSTPVVTADNEKCSAATAMFIGADATLRPSCSFEKGQNLCKHLFPRYPGKLALENSDGSDAAIGDEKFSFAEKKFWGSDPATDMTNSKEKDGASVMGLGVDEIKWTYAQGDEIGVAVEGTSTLATQHSDSSYMRMWAFSKGTCSALDEQLSKASSLTNGTRGFYMENSVGVLAADVDLNDCLEENLLVPNDGGASSMQIALAATPDSPINDPDGGGDQVTVVASVQNAENLANLFYNWKVEKSADGKNFPTEDTSWTDITATMIEKGSLASTDREGIGKDSLNFMLNLPGSLVDPDNKGVFYLRVRATAFENSGAAAVQGAVIIKAVEQQNQLNVYSVTAKDDGNLSINIGGANGGLLCSDPAGKTRCSVTKNQIMGMKVPNGNGDLSGFSWRVNDVPMTCTSDVSAECSGVGGEEFFFPILGNEGEAVDVTAKAMSKTKGAIELSRHFVIVAPQVRIISADTISVWPKVLGFYKDLQYYDSNDPAVQNTHKQVDYSTEVFETTSGKTISLQALAYSSWDFGQGYDWTIDGEIQPSSPVNDTLVFPADKSAGDSYTVGLLLKNTHTPQQYKQANNLRKALAKNWNISPEDSVSEENVSTSIQINVLEDSANASLSLNQSGIFASLITHLPEQTMFLLKITLTAFMLLFSMGLLFALIPESLFEKNQK
jgi:hypothetical protein